MKQAFSMTLDRSLNLEIPLVTARQAQIAVQVLKPDPILRPEDFKVEYTSEDNLLRVKFQSVDDRVLRVGVSSVIDSIKTIIEAMDELS